MFFSADLISAHTVRAAVLVERRSSVRHIDKFVPLLDGERIACLVYHAWTACYALGLVLLADIFLMKTEIKIFTMMVALAACVSFCALQRCLALARALWRKTPLR